MNYALQGLVPAGIAGYRLQEYRVEGERVFRDALRQCTSRVPLLVTFTTKEVMGRVVAQWEWREDNGSEWMMLGRYQPEQEEGAGQ